MPGMEENLELLRNDTSNNSLNSVFSSGIIRVKTTPTCRMIPCADNSGEESDSCSDDEGQFSPGDHEGGISILNDSENLEKTGFISRFHSISLGSDTSAGSDDSIISGSRDPGRFTGSSLESSPRSSTSDSYSGDESSEDEQELEQRQYDEIKRNYNANYEAASKNNNYKGDGSSTTPDTRGSSKNEESDDDSSDDEPEDEVEVISRGPFERPHAHGGKPYDRSSPRHEPTTEASILDNSHQQNDTEVENPENVLNELIASAILDWYPEQMDPVMEILSAEQRSSSGSPTDELPDYRQTTHGNDWGAMPEITINGVTSPIQSPQPETWQNIRPPLSSASSASLSDNNELSPVSYVDGLDSPSREQMTSGLENLMNFGSPQHASPSQLQYHEIYDDMGDQSNGHTNFDTFPDPLVSLQQVPGNLNIYQSDPYNGFSIQSASQVQTSPNQITNDTNLLGEITPTQDQKISHQMPLNDPQPHLSATHSQNSILSKTSPLSTSLGIVTIIRQNEVGRNIPVFGQTSASVQPPLDNTVNGDIAETSISEPNYEDRFLFPVPVTDHRRSSSSHERSSRNSRPLALWSLSRLPDTPAIERLQKRVSRGDLYRAMSKLFSFENIHFKDTNNNGDTFLMSIVRNPNKLCSKLAYIMPILEKMRMIPKSLMVKNQHEDALYLAAINCPQFSYVTGVLAATIAKSCHDENFWGRKYNEKNDTLIHVVAAQGDSHQEVLQELLVVKNDSSKTLFNLSATNSEGKTPLHLAVEAHNLTGGSLQVVRLLMEYGADPVIREQRNGNTALHMATSNEFCLEMIQALLHNNGGRAVNIANYDGNTPLHLAAGYLNAADPTTQEEVCRQLITAGGRTNISNKQNELPLAFVAADRRETIEQVFHKKL